MTFKEFLESQYGSVSMNNGPLQLIKSVAKMAKPVRKKGTSVGRMQSAGGIMPARPVKISSLNGPLTSKSLIK